MHRTWNYNLFLLYETKQLPSKRQFNFSLFLLAKTFIFQCLFKRKHLTSLQFTFVIKSCFFFSSVIVTVSEQHITLKTFENP